MITQKNELNISSILRLWYSVLAMICSCLYADDAVSLTASNVSPRVNDIISVNVTLTGKTPFTGASIFLAYDNTKLQLISSVDAQKTGTIVSGVDGAKFGKDARILERINASGEIHAVLCDESLKNRFTGNGSMAIFSFKALSAGIVQVTTSAKSDKQPFGMVLIQKDGTQILPTISGPLTISIVAQTNQL